MNKLIKVLNKFNGNLCFVGATDTGDYVFEVNRYGQTLSYASSTKLITDVAIEDSTAYFVAFSDQYLGGSLSGLN